MFIRHRDLLSEPLSRKTYTLAKGMQAAEGLCQPFFFISSLPRLTPFSELPTSSYWARWGIKAQFPLMYDNWWGSLLVSQGFLWSALQFSLYPILLFFLSQVLIFNKHSTPQTQSECLLLGNPACDNMIFPSYSAHVINYIHWFFWY